MRYLKWVVIYMIFLLLGSLITLFFFSRDSVVSHELKVESDTRPNLNVILDSTAMLKWKNSIKACTRVQGGSGEEGTVFHLEFYAEGETLSGQEEVLQSDSGRLVKTSLIMGENYILETQYSLRKGPRNIYWLEGVLTIKPQGFISGLYLAGSTDLLKDKLIDELNGIKSILEK